MRAAASARRPVLDLLRGSAVVGAGLAVELGAQFLRTVLLARLLGAHEFGLVASVAMLMSIADMISFIGLDRYIVFSPTGGQRDVLNVSHTLSLIRGVFSAVLILVFAIPTADLIGEPSAGLGFAVVALVPLLRGAMHLGVVQQQRVGRFWPASTAEAAGAVAGTLIAVLAALIARDYRAILWGLGAQGIVTVALTHLFARDVPYRLSFDRALMRNALRFGLPLVVNGVAIAAAFQLDRMVVGAWLGVAELGIYGLALTVLLQPISLLGRLATTALQPHLSEAWHADPEGSFLVRVREFGRGAALLGGAGAVATACAGAPTFRLVFGASYVASDAFFLLLAAVVVLRMTRAAQGVIGLAIGRTQDLMGANLLAAITLPVTIAAFYVHAGLETAVFGVIVGEALSVWYADRRLRRYWGGADRVVLADLALAALPAAAVGAWVLLVDPSAWLRFVVAGVCAAVICGVLAIRHLPPRHGARAP
jgi:O-antigen/teichoic acid export membrane protein